MSTNRYGMHSSNWYCCDKILSYAEPVSVYAIPDFIRALIPPY